jgi:hypothetical protein
MITSLHPLVEASLVFSQGCLPGWALFGIERYLDVIRHSDLHEFDPYPVDRADHEGALKWQPNSWDRTDRQEIHVIGVPIVEVVGPFVKPLRAPAVRRLRGMPTLQ